MLDTLWLKIAVSLPVDQFFWYWDHRLPLQSLECYSGFKRWFLFLLTVWQNPRAFVAFSFADLLMITASYRAATIGNSSMGYTYCAHICYLLYKYSVGFLSILFTVWRRRFWLPLWFNLDELGHCLLCSGHRMTKCLSYMIASVYCRRRLVVVKLIYLYRHLLTLVIVFSVMHVWR